MFSRNPDMSFVLVNLTRHREASVQRELFTRELQGAVAQLVARQSDHPEVVCSIPTCIVF